MKIIKNKRKGYVVSLEIEESQDVFPQALDKAFSKIQKKAKLPGFRKGKVPRKVFEQNFGKDYLVEEALQIVVNDAYVSAIKELDLKIVDYPKNIDIKPYKSDKNISFSCEVDVEPIAKLGKYKGLKIKKTVDENVDAAEIEQSINQQLSQHATFHVTEDSSAEGDILSLAMQVKVDDKIYQAWTKENASLRLGSGLYGPDVDSELVGLKTSEKKSFTVTYAADFHIEALKSKSASFDIEVLEVRQKKLPELTDEWVEKNVEDNTVKTASDFKDMVKKNLEKQKKQQSKQALEQACLDTAIADLEIDIPNAMIENEIDQSIKYFEYELKRMGISIKQYMDYQNLSLESLRDNYKESSIKSIKIRYLLDLVQKKEKISATDADLEAAVKMWEDKNITCLDDLKKDSKFDLESFRSNHSKQLTIDFLVSSSKISS